MPHKMKWYFNVRIAPCPQCKELVLYEEKPRNGATITKKKRKEGLDASTCDHTRSEKQEGLIMWLQRKGAQILRSYVLSRKEVRLRNEVSVKCILSTLDRLGEALGEGVEEVMVGFKSPSKRKRTVEDVLQLLKEKAKEKESRKRRRVENDDDVSLPRSPNKMSKTIH